MTVTSPTIKVDLNGTRTGGEEWNTGFWVAAPPALTQADLDTWTAQVNSAAITWWNAIRSLATGQTRFTRVAARYYPGGSPVATLLAEASPGLISGTSATIHPYQVAMVASLRTAIPSRRTRGRMYLPLDGVPMSADGLYASASCTTASSATATFLTSVNGIPLAAGTGDVVVRSDAAGNVQLVNRVIVDNVPDVQRRRANKLDANVVVTNPVT